MEWICSGVSSSSDIVIPRVIPCLLLSGNGLYKTVRFKSPSYIGDAVNAVKIFNEKEVDELIFLDIRATPENRSPGIDFLRGIATECFMPLSYGGGINSVSQMEKIFSVGVEKVILCTAAASKAGLVSEAAKNFGNQSIVVTIDCKKSLRGKHQVYAQCGAMKVAQDPLEYALRMQEAGAGEIFLNSIDRDGTGRGYDLDLIERISGKLDIPIAVCGGAGKLADLREAVEHGASAVAAGSLFVYHGKHRAVLITYPNRSQLETLFSEK